MKIRTKKADPFPWSCAPTILALLALVTIAVVAQPGYAQQSPATPPSAPSDPAKADSTSPDKVVIKVGDQQVTAADVDFLVRTLSAQDQKSLETQGKATLGNQYVQMLLLEQQALKDHLDTNPEFRRQQAFEHLRSLAVAEYQKMTAEVKIQPEAISQYFAAHASDFEKAEMRQVGIRVKPAGAKTDTPGLSLEDAKARAEEIRKALGAAGADPAKVAKQYAVADIVFIEPQSRTVERAQVPKELADALFGLKDGEISETKDGPQSVYFVQMIKHVHPELKEVSPTIENLLQQQKLVAEMSDMKNKTTVWTDEDFFKAPAPPKAASGAPASPAPAANGSAAKPASEKQPPK